MGHPSEKSRLRDEAIARALAHKSRPARDRARDERDHIGEVLAFASIAPGEIVATSCRSAAISRVCSRP